MLATRNKYVYGFIGMFALVCLLVACIVLEVSPKDAKAAAPRYYKSTWRIEESNITFYTSCIGNHMYLTTYTPNSVNTIQMMDDWSHYAVPRFCSD